jgi:nucleoside-diphosphate-sugar epimerase
MPANESSICYPRGFYSITKRTAEQLLISYCETFGIRYRILRLANVLGRNDSKVSAQKNALQYLINCMRDNEPIELYDDGDFYRDYIDVEDAVRAINLVITKGEINSIYNISNGHSLKFRDIIDYVHQRLNSRSEIQSIPQREFHKLVQVKTMYLDNSRLQALGYRPRYTINQTLDRLL